MKRYFLPVATMLLAACSMQTEEISSASAKPAQTEAADSDINARLAVFFDDFDKERLAFRPSAKAYRGIRDDDYGRWDDLSDAEMTARHNRRQAAVAKMRESFDPEKLNESSRLSYRLFETQAQRNAAAYKFRKNLYVFDQMNGAQSDIPAFLINIHNVSNKQDAEAYVSRLRGIAPHFDVLIAQAKERAEAGVIVPDWVFPYVIADAKNVIDGAPFDDGPPSPLLDDFNNKVAALDLPAEKKAALTAAAVEALLQYVKPAYQKLIAEMKRQQENASDGDGVWRFSDGSAFYAERLKHYTTTDLNADQIHQLGLKNVARIHGDMRKIMNAVGFDGNLQEFFVHLRTGDQYFYESRKAYLADVDKKLAGMKAVLPKFFNILPEAPLIVKPVEAFREKSAGKAFYQSPAVDGSRPGTYYVNLYKLKNMSKTELEALAYHEGLPGHHMQRAIQTELGDLPAFRKFGNVTAYSEGWGLYSEELGKDMGFYSDPYSDFGRLGMELWRACRLVVDTGIHKKGWSREKAIAYLTENTPNPDGDIRKAIERYIVYPGQATAYMIGKLKILELRKRAQRQLGLKFTMGDFHDVILRSGPVPLNILEERVNAWINVTR